MGREDIFSWYEQNRPSDDILELIPHFGCMKCYREILVNENTHRCPYCGQSFEEDNIQ